MKQATEMIWIQNCTIYSHKTIHSFERWPSEEGKHKENDLLHRIGDEGVCSISTEPSGRGMLTRNTSRARVLFFFDPATPMRASTSALRSFRIPTQSTLHRDNKSITTEKLYSEQNLKNKRTWFNFFMRCFAQKVHFFGVTKTYHYRVKVHTLASCWCLDRGPPRWQSSHQCQPLGRLLCCGRSPCKLGKIHEASLAQHRFQQTPATPPAHSLPPAEPVTKKEQLDFFFF